MVKTVKVKQKLCSLVLMDGREAKGVMREWRLDEKLGTNG
jgi:hypothetical protein